MSAQPCPGRCNSTYWRAWSAYQAEDTAYDPLDPSTSRPGPPGDDLVREYGQPVWCAEHSGQIRLALPQLDDLAAILAAAADGHRSHEMTQRVGGTSVVRSQSEVHDQPATSRRRSPAGNRPTAA
jgi:hypothetical protein